MHRSVRWSVSVATAVLLASLGPGPAAGQTAAALSGTQDTTPRAEPGAPDRLTEEDYRRAERFMGRNARELVYGAEVEPNWLKDGKRFWYRNRFREGHEFVLADAEAGSRRRAFDHQRLADALSRASDTGREPFDLPFESFEFVDEERAIEFVVDPEENEENEENGEDVEEARGDEEETKQRWRCDIQEYRCEGPLELHPEVPNSIVSPDGRYAAYIEDHDLWVRELETGEDIRLTTDGEHRYGYATDSQGWRRTDDPVLLWAPDSRRIATYRLDEREVEEMHLLETSEPRPVLHSWPYALPGDSIVPLHERVVIHVEDREVVLLDTEPDHQRTSSCCGLTRDRRWADGRKWADVEWSVGGERLAFVSTSRDYRTVTLRLADPHTGQVRPVYSESHPKFFLTNIRSMGIPNWRVLHDLGRFIWFSERDGHGHLYLHDLETGELLNRITGGDWNVVDILAVDEEAGRVVFTGVGREEDRNPYFRHLYSVSLDGSGLTLLTPEPADHEISLSPSGRYLADVYSTPEEPPVTVARRASDGRATVRLEEADISELEETGWRPPEVFTVRARDGVTELYGLLFRPSDFEPSRSYPVVNAIYPGPQTGSVRIWGFTVSPRLDAQALAELGFIVVQIDALGNPFRSKKFHSFYHGDMGDNGLEDQVAGMRQLAERHPWIDLDRVGIYGHSGGGYATAGALLRFPDFFHVGVSSAGNHDNRGYTYYWGERWQGPLEVREDGTDTYENQANHPLAGELRGRLLLTYGTMDPNVHPNMSLLLIDELIEHGHDFDVMVYPNRGHGYGGEPHHVRLTWDYFVTHLLGRLPPENFRIGR